MSEYGDLERRIRRLEEAIDEINNRLGEGSRTMATHAVTLKGLCDYQDKQNGALLRIADKFEEHTKWLNRWMYGIGVSLFFLLLGVFINMMTTAG